MTDAEKFLVGRKIAKAEVDGFGIKLTFENGDVFEYTASDGGYSLLDMYKGGDAE